MIFLPLETELFYYEHLLDSSDNLQLIQDFCVTNTSGYGLERYIKELAESDEKDGSARTYLVKDRFTHEIVAYFSLKTGLFTIDAGNDYFYSISGIELANFAVNSSYRKNHPDAKNLGSTVFAEFVLPSDHVIADVPTFQKAVIQAAENAEMKTIQVKDILDIYKLCGLNGDENTVIRNSINLGTLKRRLNLGSSTDSLHSTIVKSNCTETLKNINTKFDVKIL